MIIDPRIRRAIEDWRFFCRMWHLALRRLPAPLSQEAFAEDRPFLEEVRAEALAETLERSAEGMRLNREVILAAHPDAEFDLWNCEVRIPEAPKAVEIVRRTAPPPRILIVPVRPAAPARPVPARRGPATVME